MILLTIARNRLEPPIVEPNGFWIEVVVEAPRSISSFCCDDFSQFEGYFELTLSYRAPAIVPDAKARPPCGMLIIDRGYYQGKDLWLGVPI